MSSELVGTGALFRLAARRDRFMIPLSVAGLVLLSVGSAQATLDLYPDAAAAESGLSEILANPAVTALYGQVATSGIAALAVFKTVMMGAILTAVLGYVVVRRHTRAEEEDGRLELLGSGVVGRQAPVTAAVALALVAVVAAGGLSALGLAALGLDARGSAAFAVSWIVAGVATVGATALAAQLAGTARGVAGLVLGFLGVSFLLRAVADTASGSAAGALRWLSPLGWTGAVQPFGADRFWVLGLGVAFALGCLVAAYALLGRRDLGSGVLAQRPGRATAAPRLKSPMALVARLARGSVIGWTVGVGVMAAVVGSLLGSVAQMAGDPAVRTMLEALSGSAGTIEDIFVATEMRFAAAAIAGAGIAVALRLAAAERSGIGEVVLSTPTSRRSWFGAHAALALGLPLLLLAVLGAVLGAVGSATTPGAPSLGASLAAALALAPPVWVVVGAALLLAGLSARHAPWAWGALLLAFLVGELGHTIGLPEWVVHLSPLGHVQQLPGGTFQPTSTLVLTAVAAALTVAGATAYQRRDVA